MFAAIEPAPPADEFQFPKTLAEKYQPKKLEDFVGVHEPRKVMQAFVKSPFKSAWFFLGESGLGKTSMAEAVAGMIGGEVHTIASQACNVENIETAMRICAYVPKGGRGAFHVVIVNEANEMSSAGQDKFLSILDRVPDQTIFFFTSNGTDRLAKRFLSRCRVLPFKAQTVESELAAYLEKIYKAEGGTFPCSMRRLDASLRSCMGTAPPKSGKGSKL